MPQMPVRLPRIDRQTEKALVYSVDRSKLPNLSSSYTATPWSEDDAVLSVLQTYLFDPHAQADSNKAIIVTRENVDWLYKNSEPCVA